MGLWTYFDKPTYITKNWINYIVLISDILKNDNEFIDSILEELQLKSHQFLDEQLQGMEDHQDKEDP